jgi:putative integral membrane protein (TIGR02587 family)
MVRGWGDELREQGRGIVGALLVIGTTFLYTMETWWWGWTLPIRHLLIYAVLGLGVVLAITRNVGFRGDDTGDGENENGGLRKSIRETAFSFAELVFQSFLTAYLVLLVIGVVEIGDPWIHVARLGLLEVVPLGFGAAMANELLQGEKQTGQRSFPTMLATFSIGAVFVSGGIAPTQEIELIAAHMGWGRAAMLVVLSLLVAYLMLYELELRGQEGRIRNRSKRLQFGEVFLVYAVALVVGAGMLAAFGHFDDVPLPVMVTMVVVVSFPASIGANAARVVI